MTTEDKLLELLKSVAVNITDIGDNFSCSDSIFNSGTLDSMTMITFLSLVEETYSLNIFDDDFDASKFDTIDMIKNFIESEGKSLDG